MSWVTNVILIFSLEEVFDENFKMIETSPALININSWLKKNDIALREAGIGMEVWRYGGMEQTVKRFQDLGMSRAVSA